MHEVKGKAKQKMARFADDGEREAERRREKIKARADTE